jgi:hypothetical protein
MSAGRPGRRVGHPRPHGLRRVSHRTGGWRGEFGDDPPPGVDNTTTFRGTIAGRDGLSGIVELTIQALVSAGTGSSTLALHAGPDAVSGSLKLNQGGPTIALAGQYEHSASQINLSGGGYTLEGVVQSNGILEGTFQAAGQGGGLSMLNSTTAFVTAYCGSFAGQEPDDRGTWNVHLPASVGQMSGVAVQDGSGDGTAPPRVARRP